MKRPEIQTQGKEKVRKDLAAVQRTIVRKLRSKWGRAVLLDLANLGDRDCQRFRRRWGVFLPPDVLEQDDGRIRAWRDQLRKVWNLGLEAGLILDSWMKEGLYDPNRWHTPLWIIDSDFMEPNPGHLGFVLALTIRDLVGKLGHCPNPECPHPYFIKGRKNQRFCDRPACAAHGQREHKRKWWKERGEEWRRKWGKVRTSQSKKQRKGER